MEIRKTTANDIDAIMDIFASAKCYMKANGNASQWDDNYPGRDTLDNDIANGNSYVFIDNGEVVGNFKQISQLSFHRLANGDKSWFSRRFRHLSYREKLRITLRPSAQLSVQK